MQELAVSLIVDEVSGATANRTSLIRLLFLHTALPYALSPTWNLAFLLSPSSQPFLLHYLPPIFQPPSLNPHPQDEAQSERGRLEREAKTGRSVMDALSNVRCRWNDMMDCVVEQFLCLLLLLRMRACGPVSVRVREFVCIHALLAAYHALLASHHAHWLLVMPCWLLIMPCWLLLAPYSPSLCCR